MVPQGSPRIGVRRQTVVVLVTLMTVLSLFAVTPVAATPSSMPTVGDGSETNPYVITTVEELRWMENDLDAHYVLGNPIDASATVGWDGGKGFDPVGNETDRFNGSFDGQGYEIDGLFINRSTEDGVGLFGDTTSGVRVQSVHLTNVDVSGADRVGSLVGSFGFGVASVRTGGVSDSSASGGSSVVTPSADFSASFL